MPSHELKTWLGKTNTRMPKEYTLADFDLVSFDTPDKSDKRKFVPNPKKTTPRIITMNPNVFVVFRGQYYMRVDVPSEPIAKNAIEVELQKLNRAFEAARPSLYPREPLRVVNIAGYHPDGTPIFWQYQDPD